MQIDKADVDDRVSWNMASLVNMEISNNKTKANEYFSRAEFIQSFQHLMAIKFTAVQTFKDHQREALLKLENDFFKCSGVLNSRLSSVNPKLYEKVRGIIFKIYSDYAILLQDLLESKGFLGDKQTDASKLKGYD